MSVQTIQRPPATPAVRATVSVVVPCYNYGHYLPTCVASILDQPGVDVDVLIIDDASPDGSAEVAHRLAGQDARVRVVAHERNAGHIATYNEGLALATGQYTLLLSADDLLTPGALARAAAAFEAHPGVGLVYGDRIPLEGDVLPAPRTDAAAWRVWPGRDWFAQVCRLGRNVVASPEVVVRTEVQRRVGGYRADLPHSGDLEMWLRVAARSDVARVLGADQAYYRQHPASMSRSIYYPRLMADLEGRRDAFGSVLGELPAGSWARRCRADAARALADDALRLIRWQEVAGEPTAGERAELAAFVLATLPQAGGLGRGGLSVRGRASGSPERAVHGTAGSLAGRALRRWRLEGRSRLARDLVSEAEFRL
jgi:hypothetical protein